VLLDPVRRGGERVSGESKTERMPVAVHRTDARHLQRIGSTGNAHSVRSQLTGCFGQEKEGKGEVSV
jgi:hypothetical protein